MWLAHPLLNLALSWRYIRTESSLVKAIQNQVELTSIIFTIITMLFMLVVIRLTLAMIASLKDLAETSRLMKNGDYEARMSVDGPDELGILAKSFNEMADSIQRQIAEIEKQGEVEKSLRKSKFDLEISQLKNQMRPHFLFNSLHMIGSLIEMDAELAADTTHELAIQDDSGSLKKN